MERLIFIRDNKNYTIAKLKDDKCWMTQNLRLGDNSRIIQLSASDTNIQNPFSLPKGSTSGFSSNDAINIYVNTSNDNYGGYYTWRAATANNTIESGDSTTSICPKNWRLPTREEAEQLFDIYNSTTIRQAPANFVFSGGYYSSAIHSQDTEGYWWLATSVNKDLAQGLYLDKSEFRLLYSGGGNRKSDGKSIRCVADN